MRVLPGRASVGVNLVVYYAGWVACVLGAAHDQWALGASAGALLVALHLGLAERRDVELRVLLFVSPIGFLVDSVQTASGSLVFSSGQALPWLAPAWIGVMWMLFSATLRYTFHWLAERPALAAVFGAAGGPAAFYAGNRLGAVAFHPLPGLSLLVLAVVWAALLPLLLRVASCVGGGEPGRYRRWL